MNGNHLLGIVLCGGKSSRMGQDKTRLPHPDGGTFLQHAIDRIKPLCELVCVAGAPDQHLPTVSETFLPDDVPYIGPVTGIIGALQHALERGLAACLVTPVDMPHLRAGDLTAIISAWQQNSQLTCGISVSGEYLQPLVAIYPTSMLDALRALASGEDRSLYRWIQNNPHQIVPLSDHACHNVNTPSDVDRR